jgi:hypothetical protein
MGGGGGASEILLFVSTVQNGQFISYLDGKVVSLLTVLRQCSSTWSTHTPGVREDVLGACEKILRGMFNWKENIS